jgi:hypothetical protein
MSTYRVNPLEYGALARVFDVAEGYGGGALRARKLLCAWWNGAELGGFDFADLWSLDDDILQSALVVIGLIARLPSGTYPDKWPEFAERMRALAIRRAEEIAK